MRIVYFTHSLVSCWNHGNAHFLRGVLRALAARGHDVVAYEPAESWSRTNLLAEQDNDPITSFATDFPGLCARILASENHLDEALDGADLVIVHEWNEPALVAAIGRHRKHAAFTLLFHDTHHRAVSDPDAIHRFELAHYDGVLAFGAALARIYQSWGWGARAFVWHEAADTALFHPPSTTQDRHDAVWIGNWGDGERSFELEHFLLAPAQQAGVALHVYGVRYPDTALQKLQSYGAKFHGWTPNAKVPALFARHRLTVHVPRRFYTTLLPGIPTIRVFEALACGIPLVCSPWDDCEHLFRPGHDYLVARNGDEMAAHMRALVQDDALASDLAANGLSRIQALHSCDVRAAELLAIAARLSPVTAEA